MAVSDLVVIAAAAGALAMLGALAALPLRQGLPLGVSGLTTVAAAIALLPGVPLVWGAAILLLVVDVVTLHWRRWRGTAHQYRSWYPGRWWPVPTTLVIAVWMVVAPDTWRYAVMMGMFSVFGTVSAWVVGVRKTGSS